MTRQFGGAPSPRKNRDTPGFWMEIIDPFVLVRGRDACIRNQRREWRARRCGFLLIPIAVRCTRQCAIARNGKRSVC